MNIFALHQSPQESARVHCDQHLHKMILESAQIVSTAFHLRKFSITHWLYRPAYPNHPCTIWTAASDNNMLWLLELATELETIREELNCPYHSSSNVIKFARDYMQEERSAANSFLAHDPALAMPIHIKMRSDIDSYEKYRTYYRWKNQQWTVLDKRPMTWKNRPVPSFMEPLPILDNHSYNSNQS
jgi:hypothetical protein